MKAVILAAGRGSRIKDITCGSPKSLLRFGDRTILDLQLDSLFRAGLNDIAIVVGWRSEEIIDHVSRRLAGSPGRVEFISNHEFDLTNNMYSLAQAREWLAGEPFLCINADVLHHPDILFPILDRSEDIAVLIDREFHEETTKVVISGGEVLDLRKDISRDDSSGTFVNMATFSPRGSHELFTRAAALFEKGRKNQFFNDVIRLLITGGLRVGFAETDGLPWAEIDDAGDLVYARTQVFPRLDAHDILPSVLTEKDDHLSSVA